MQSPTRIGIVCDGSQADGNLELNACRFARELQDSGLETVIFAGADWPAKLEEFSPVERLQTSEGPIEFANRLADLNPSKHCDQLVSLERVWECDVYWARHGVHEARLPLWAKHARSARGESAAYPKRWDEGILQLEKQLFDPGFTERRILAPTERVRYELAQHHGLSISRIPVVYDGFKHRGSQPGEHREEMRRKLGIAGDEVLILAHYEAGEPGLAYAEAAARRLRKDHFRLLFTGSAPKPRFPGPTIYLGPVDSLCPYLDAADLLLYPTAYEPCSERSMHAMAHGIPVLTNTTNGASEFLWQRRSGFADDPSQISDLVDAAQGWQDAERRKRMRARLPNRWKLGFTAAHFTWELGSWLEGYEPSAPPTDPTQEGRAPKPSAFRPRLAQLVRAKVEG